MLPGEIGMTGHVVQMTMWEPFHNAPKDGRSVAVRRKNGKVERARYWLGAWRRGAIPLLYLAENDTTNPVTHFHA